MTKQLTKANSAIFTDRGTFFGLSNDTIIKMLQTNGSYEPHVIELFDKLIEPGNFVMDIGASIGYHSVHLSKLVGVHGLVFAVEPQRLIHNFLCANLALNSCHNVMTLQKAVGNSTGELTLSHIDYDDPNLNSGCQRIGVGGEKVEQITLDSLQLDRQLRFIKIDAQGAEPFIIAGGIKTFTTKVRPIICFEVEDIWLRALGSSTNQLLNIILNLEYVILRIKSNYPCDHLAVPIELWSHTEDKLKDYSLKYDLIKGRSVAVDLFDNNLYSTFRIVGT